MVDVEIVEDVSAFRVVKDFDDGDQNLDNWKLTETENATDVLENRFRQLPMSVQLKRKGKNDMF